MMWVDEKEGLRPIVDAIDQAMTRHMRDGDGLLVQTRAYTEREVEAVAIAALSILAQGTVLREGVVPVKGFGVFNVRD